MTVTSPLRGASEGMVLLRVQVVAFGVQGHAPPAQLASAQLFAARLGQGPMRVVLMKNMTKAVELHVESERTDVSSATIP